MECFESGTSTIYCDDRFFPVLITRWVGTATVTNCERYAQWFDERVKRAETEGRLVVSVSDASEAQRPPPEVRRFFGEWLQQQNNGAVESHSMVVIRSALVRGALTAIGWVAPSVRDLVIVESMDEALHKTREFLRSRDLPVPVELNVARYEPMG